MAKSKPIENQHADDVKTDPHGSYNSFTREHHDPHADDHLAGSQRDRQEEDFPTFRDSEQETYTAEELADLAKYDSKLALIRAAVRSVVGGFKTGMYLWGEGGTSKSWTVDQELKALNCDAIPFNTRVTGKGLFRLIQAHPHEIIVIEDAETLFKDATAAGVLRGALWSQDTKSRVKTRPVTWVTDKGIEKVIFTGGLIIIANEKLSGRSSALKAAMGRISKLELSVSNGEVKTLMKRICASGYDLDGETVLTPQQCWEVGQFIIDNSLGKSLNLRDLIKGFQSRHQYESDETELDWRAMVLADLSETAGVGSSRSYSLYGDNDTKDRIAVMVDAAPVTGAEKLELWREWTKKRFKKDQGFGKQSYYDALERVRAKPGFREMVLKTKF